MTQEKIFEEKIVELKQEIENLKDASSHQVIEKTAVRLEGLNYAPPVIIPLAAYFRLTEEALFDEIDKIIAMPDKEACSLAPDEPEKCQDLKVQFISVLIFYYKKLVLLRNEDIETWDEIDELYVHD